MTGTFWQRVLAHLVVDLLVAEIEFGAQARPRQVRVNLARVVVGVRGDRGDDDLRRREPQREMPGVVLDEDAEEALHRAADGAMDHHRRLLLAVGVDVVGAEPLRQVEIDLRGAALPVATDGVAQHILELRAVEGALARVDGGLDAAARLFLDLLQHVRHHGLGVIPRLVRTDALLRPGRELDHELGEAEVAVGRDDQVVDAQALRRDLLFGAEHVRVVLREAAHAQEPVQRARRLVAMHRAELGNAERQVAIRLQAVLENLDMARAVHRLDDVDPIAVVDLIARRLRHEHVLAERHPVAGSLPQRLVEQLRCVDLVIDAAEPPPHVGDERLEHRPALGVPEDDARPLLLEMEEVHLAAEAPVIALLRFLEHGEVAA